MKYYGFHKTRTLTFISLVACLKIFLTGCVGLGTSIPRSSVEIMPVSSQEISSDLLDDYPRESTRHERVVKNSKNQTITYESKGSGCYSFLVFIPLYFSNRCGIKEVWDYSIPGQVTLNKHAHYYYGLVCSPIPYMATLFVGESSNTLHQYNGTVWRSLFCDYRYDTKMNEFTVSVGLGF